MRIPDLTNCTRLRLWQPVHAGIRRHLSIDNLFNFSCSMNNTSTKYDKQEKAGIHGLLTVWFCTAQLHWVQSWRAISRILATTVLHGWLGLVVRFSRFVPGWHFYFVNLLSLTRDHIFPCFYRDNALVFHGELGEQQVFTGDAMIAPESVLQFEV